MNMPNFAAMDLQALFIYVVRLLFSAKARAGRMFLLRDTALFNAVSAQVEDQPGDAVPQTAMRAWLREVNVYINIPAFMGGGGTTQLLRNTNYRTALAYFQHVRSVPAWL